MYCPVLSVEDCDVECVGWLKWYHAWLPTSAGGMPIGARGRERWRRVVSRWLVCRVGERRRRNPVGVKSGCEWLIVIGGETGGPRYVNDTLGFGMWKWSGT